MWDEIVKELEDLSEKKFSPSLHLVAEMDSLATRIRLSVGKKSLMTKEGLKLFAEGKIGVSDMKEEVKGEVEDIQTDIKTLIAKRRIKVTKEEPKYGVENIVKF